MSASLPPFDEFAEDSLIWRDSRKHLDQVPDRSEGGIQCARRPFVADARLGGR
jgi:hypothetical protein